MTFKEKLNQENIEKEELDRLEKQINFIVEVDKLKTIFRQSPLMFCDRKENDAEHSWHLAMMAILLSEHSKDSKVDILKVMKMVLIHDIVEIDAGDTYIYDKVGYMDKSERETKAANRIFNILPEDQAKELIGLWREFEERETPEARFAASLDRFQPLLHNYYTKGISWQEHKITSDMVKKINQPIEKGSKVLWSCADAMIEESVENGYLKR